MEDCYALPYLSTDAVLPTPFARSVMPRDDFLQIMTFLHCCDDATYPGRNEEAKKLGKVFDRSISPYLDTETKSFTG